MYRSVIHIFLIMKKVIESGMEQIKKHPFDRAIELNTPYTYWHMREIDRATIEEAIRRGTSIELDIAFDEETGEIYVGHPKEFYTIEKQTPLPHNIGIDEAVAMIKDVEDLVLVLDCKHEKALPKIKEIIETLGQHRCILHAFIKEWSVPYPADIHQEAHWRVEDVPLAAIQKVQQETGVKTIGAIHALSVARLENEELLNRALETAEDTFESISIYLPGVATPPFKHLKQIVDKGYLPWLSQDELEASGEKFDFAYVGMSDDPTKATVNREFLNS